MLRKIFARNLAFDERKFSPIREIVSRARKIVDSIILDDKINGARVVERSLTVISS